MSMSNALARIPGIQQETLSFNSLSAYFSFLFFPLLTAVSPQRELQIPLACFQNIQPGRPPLTPSPFTSFATKFLFCCWTCSCLLCDHQLCPISSMVPFTQGHRWLDLSSVLVYCVEVPFFLVMDLISCKSKGREQRNDSPLYTYHDAGLTLPDCPFNPGLV